jgi:hypothetical protein
MPLHQNEVGPGFEIAVELAISPLCGGTPLESHVDLAASPSRRVDLPARAVVPKSKAEGG